jgi:pSer/pThr/pTyr-binding forkhead associated (FHA) protein
MHRPKGLVLKLDKITGPGEVPALTLRPGERASVGRTRAADHALPDDEQLSRIHFALEFEAASCRIHDLGSNNGTFLNGARIEEAVLQPGDVISAGQTTFAVQFDDGTKRRRSTILRKRGGTSRSKSRRPASGESTPQQQTARKRSVRLASAIAADAAAAPSAANEAAVPRRVCLTIESGPLQGRRIWLRPEQRIEVGRGHRSDWAIPSDPSMSQRHFALDFGPAECHIRDIGSSFGTFVNGAKAVEAVARDGDVIVAGKTTFRLQCDAASTPLSKSPAESSSCHATDHPSGVVQYHGCGVAPAEIVRMLMRTMRLYVVVDSRKLPAPPPNPVYLADWIPQSAAARLSPMILPPSDGFDAIALVEETWGKDAMACFFSDWDAPRVLAHLRISARGQHGPNAIPKPDHMFGLCSPSLLRPLLATCTKRFARHLFQGVGAVLIEGESRANWDLRAGVGFSVRLAGIQDKALQNLFGHDEAMPPRRRAKRPSTLLGHSRAKSKRFPNGQR